MAHLDIFKDDAFSMQSLTKAINEQPYVPGRIGALGLFSEEGVNTTSVSVEKLGETLSLRVAASNRDCYAQGALLAAEWLYGKPPGLYGMSDVLGL